MHMIIKFNCISVSGINLNINWLTYYHTVYDFTANNEPRSSNGRALNNFMIVITLTVKSWIPIEKMVPYQGLITCVSLIIFAYIPAIQAFLYGLHNIPIPLAYTMQQNILWVIHYAEVCVLAINDNTHTMSQYIIQIATQREWMWIYNS